MKHLALGLLLVAGLANAGTIPQKPPVKYQYRNWRIDNASVCYNYPRGSVIYRNCRSHALQIFRQRCALYKGRVESAGAYATSSDRHAKAMFCAAASTYTPVN